MDGNLLGSLDELKVCRTKKKHVCCAPEAPEVVSHHWTVKYR